VPQPKRIDADPLGQAVDDMAIRIVIDPAAENAGHDAFNDYAEKLPGSGQAQSSSCT
jgi:hypothetical protein